MVWDEWGRLTRFVESARIAFEREKRLWQALELDAPGAAKIRVGDGPMSYRASLDQHRAALTDEWLLFGLALVYSFALVEAAAADELGVAQVTDLNGIEAWAKRLLDGAGNGWADVRGGLAGAVEVAVVRNLIAHGEQTYSASAINRLAAAGVTGREVGERVLMDYATLREFRARLKSLLRAGKVRG